MHSYTCERCGKEKLAKYKSHIKRFCSHKCSKQGVMKVARIKIKCVQCNDDFELLESVKRAREANGNVIKYCSKYCEGKSRKILTPKQCLNCKIEFQPKRSSSKYCKKECVIIHQKELGIRKKSGYWFEKGYKVLYLEGDRSIKEHIKVMEDYIGRKLHKNEVVHHIDENKLNNDLSNLQLMTRSEHSKLHRELELSRGKKLF